jgi:hypothetical protein
MSCLSGVRVLLACVTCTLSATAMAAIQVPVGWYLEGNVGTYTVSDTDYGPGTSVESSGFSWGVNAGYKFIPFLAGEVGYARFGNGKIKNDDVTLSDIKFWGADIAGKGILPIVDSGFELFAKLGVSWLQAKASGTQHTANGLFIGAGGDYSFEPHIPVNIQWTRMNGDSRTGTIDFYSIGVAYIFC